MSLVVLDFECKGCETEWEDLVESNDRRSPCPDCGEYSTTTLLCSPGIAAFSIKTREDQAASLKKRSKEHSKKLMKRDADKFFPGK